MFSVIWSPSASGDFAAFALSHMNRLTEIDDAAGEIDDQFRTDPMGNGQHISEGLWRVIVKPLAAFYILEGTEVNISAVGWVD